MRTTLTPGERKMLNPINEGRGYQATERIEKDVRRAEWSNRIYYLYEDSCTLHYMWQLIHLNTAKLKNSKF